MSASQLRTADQKSADALQQLISRKVKPPSAPPTVKLYAAVAKLFQTSATPEDALTQLLLAPARYKCVLSLGIGETFLHAVRICAFFFSFFLSFIIYIWPGSLPSFNRRCFSNQSIKQQTSRVQHRYLSWETAEELQQNQTQQAVGEEN